MSHNCWNENCDTVNTGHHDPTSAGETATNTVRTANEVWSNSEEQRPLEIFPPQINPLNMEDAIQHDHKSEGSPHNPSPKPEPSDEAKQQADADAASQSDSSCEQGALDDPVSVINSLSVKPQPERITHLTAQQSQVSADITNAMMKLLTARQYALYRLIEMLIQESGKEHLPSGRQIIDAAEKRLMFRPTADDITMAKKVWKQLHSEQHPENSYLNAQQTSAGQQIDYNCVIESRSLRISLANINMVNADVLAVLLREMKSA